MEAPLDPSCIPPAQRAILAILPDRVLAAYVCQKLKQGIALRDVKFTDDYATPARVRVLRLLMRLRPQC